MSDQDTFERILAALHEAMLDDAAWPATSALIDEACGTVGNALLVGEGPPDDIRTHFVELYYRGQHREDLKREWLEVYHPINECIPRFLQLPDSQMVFAPALYTAEELKTSRAYNEGLRLLRGQQSVMVRLDGPAGCTITWVSGDSASAAGWAAPQRALLQGLLPHIRQFVRVRQALVKAGALGVSETGLLDNTRVGVIHLDRRGRIVEANDRARAILRQGTVLADRDGELQARQPADHARLARLLAGALPTAGAPAVSGSMTLRRGVRVAPVRGARQTRARAATGLWRAACGGAGADYRAGATSPDIDPALVAAGPGADPGGKPGRGQWLAQGQSRCARSPGRWGRRKGPYGGICIRYTTSTVSPARRTWCGWCWRRPRTSEPQGVVLSLSGQSRALRSRA